MHTQEIPPDQWRPFLDRFSQEHEGWLTSIEVLDDAHGPLSEAQWQPLQGVSLDTKGTQPSSVAISVGNPTGMYIRHLIELPLHIRLVDDPPGSDVALQIEPATGPKTLLHLRGPIH